MITLPFGKIDLVFMLLPRRLLLVRMIAGVVVMRYQGRSLLLSFYFFLLREFWDRGGWMWSMDLWMCCCVDLLCM